jgi:nucleoside-diphosphate-sugar epimerase
LSGIDAVVHNGPPRAGDVRDSLADVSAARAAFGFDPAQNMDANLAAYIAWARGEVARTTHE